MIYSVAILNAYALESEEVYCEEHVLLVHMETGVRPEQDIFDVLEAHLRKKHSYDFSTDSDVIVGDFIHREIRQIIELDFDPVPGVGFEGVMPVTKFSLTFKDISDFEKYLRGNMADSPGEKQDVRFKLSVGE